MEDRKRRFGDATDVRKRVEEVVKKLFANAPPFDGIHPFTPHADVPDDTALRLVVLPPEVSYLKDALRPATDSVLEYLRSHGGQPRHRSNRLMFVAADQSVLDRLRDATRVAMAWASIVDDVDEGRLNIDQNQKKQAEKESQAAAAVLPRVARECFRWLLCPVQNDPKADRPAVEAFALNTTSGTAGGELERVCKENELVITKWSPTHLRTELKALYWKPGRPAVPVGTFWEDSLRYLYLPRLKTHDVLASIVRAGAASQDFFGTAYGEAGGKYDGFQFGSDVSVDDTLLLIEPEAAKQYEIDQKKEVVSDPPVKDRKGGNGGRDVPISPKDDREKPGKTDPKPPPRATSFRGTADVPAATAKVRLVEIAEEIVSLLASDSKATVRVTLEIAADFPSGVDDAIRRGVTENAMTLKFKTKDWE
jgi:hypothetical protein